MRKLLLIMLASLSMTASNASAEETVDDIFMDDGAQMEEVIPPADGGEVAGPVTEEEAAMPAESQAVEPEPTKSAPEKFERPVRGADRAEAPKAPKAQATRKVASAKGGFKVLRTDCELHQDASSESPVILTSKSSRKLWVEEQDANWVKGYHKGGSGFFNSSCFE